MSHEKERTKPRLDYDLCQRIAERVLATEAWKSVHRAHLTLGDDFGTAPFEHPSGEWFWTTCPCGAKHLCIREPEELTHAR